MTRRKRIADMTADEIMTEQTLRTIENAIKRAKKKANEAQAAEMQVYKMLEDACVDLTAPTKAENADNLDEAISCYLSYDEYSLAGLMEEIRENYEKNGSDQK
ncbi:MAG: hypothetical protein IJ418_13450 [Clostridia bacterium]|nr:hypothetical protein [Clostridia bacterium]